MSRSRMMLTVYRWPQNEVLNFTGKLSTSYLSVAISLRTTSTNRVRFDVTIGLMGLKCTMFAKNLRIFTEPKLFKLYLQTKL